MASCSVMGPEPEPDLSMNDGTSYLSTLDLLPLFFWVFYCHFHDVISVVFILVAFLSLKHLLVPKCAEINGCRYPASAEVLLMMRSLCSDIWTLTKCLIFWHNHGNFLQLSKSSRSKAVRLMMQLVKRCFSAPTQRQHRLHALTPPAEIWWNPSGIFITNELDSYRNNLSMSLWLRCTLGPHSQRSWARL